MKCFGFLITKIPSRSPNLLRKPAFTALPLVTCVRGMPERRAWTWHLDQCGTGSLTRSSLTGQRCGAPLRLVPLAIYPRPSGRTTGSETRSHTVTSSIQFSGTADPRRPAEQRHRQEGSNPGPCCSKPDIRPVLGVADDGKRGQQVPHATPRSRRHTAL